MQPTNEEIAELFDNMGALLELKGDSIFKIRAYQRAARTIEQLSIPLSQAVEEGKNLKEIPGNVKANLSICPVKWMDEVLEIALERMPEPRQETGEFAGIGQAKKKTDDRPPPEGDRPISAH